MMPCARRWIMRKRSVDMAKMFGREELLKALGKIGAALGRDATVFVLGGGAMCFRNQKDATKDLDLVFLKTHSAGNFTKCARRIGFARPPSIGNEYQMMGAYDILENADGFRLDVFCKTVCGALSLSQRMEKRAEPFGKFGRLEVLLVSNEDVILFKAITQRARDADDIAAVVRAARINWDAILNECKEQSMEHKWYGLVYNKLAEIEEKHGISAQIMGELLELDKKTILEEAYAEMLSRGMKREDALALLRKKGFTKKELEGL